MINIVFDLMYSQPTNGVRFHGGGEYTKTIFFELVKYSNLMRNQNDDQILIYVVYDTDKYIDEEIQNIIKKNKDFLIVASVKYTEDIMNVIQDLSKKVSLTFFSGMIYPYSKCVFPNNVRKVGICHGLRMIELPKDKYSLLYFGKEKNNIKDLIRFVLPKWVLIAKSKKMYINSISKFDIVYTDSYHSLFSIKTNCFSDKIKTTVTKHYPALKYNSFQNSLYNDQYASMDYILMVSADRWEKNAYRGIIALDSLFSKGFYKDLIVIVLGNYPMLLRRMIKNKKNFVFKDYVDSEELEAAYKNCKIFFYPTLNEGFGSPPMEAMKYDKTCVVSAVCSLTEVYSDSVYYVNPYDITEMMTRLIEAIERNIDISKIRNRYKELEIMQKESMEGLIKDIIGVL